MSDNATPEPADAQIPPRKHGFFRDLFGGAADLAAPLWRAWWDHRYYRAQLTQSSVAAFSFLIVFVALAWFARSGEIARAAGAPAAQAVLDKVFENLLHNDGVLKLPEGKSLYLALAQGKKPALVLASKNDAPQALAQSALLSADADALRLRLHGGETREFSCKDIAASPEMRAQIRALQRAQLQPLINETYVVRVFAELIERLLEALVFALALRFVLRARRVGYAACIRLAIVAMAPGLLAAAVLNGCGILGQGAHVSYTLTLCVGQLPFWALTAFYLCFAARAVCGAANAQQPA